MKKKSLNRRQLLEKAALITGALGAGTLVACHDKGSRYSKSMGSPLQLQVTKLRTPWQTKDPFLFCVYHHDNYPPGDGQLGPNSSLAGRRIGSDFSGKDGWSMYHGKRVPGFPKHPHRGFETLTVTRKGLIDHSDSLGAVARYGHGDAQWMTAGRGIAHAEMFPLLDTQNHNQNEFFQIWINLPMKDKLTQPYFSMFWADQIPVHQISDKNHRRTVVRTIAGALPSGRLPPKPPPHSWAANPTSNVAVWTIRLEAHAHWTLPAVPSGVYRSLYFFRGKSMVIGGQPVAEGYRVFTEDAREISLQAGEQGAEVLLLQGKPIDEPVAKKGPFVMNTKQEIKQAYLDYRKTRFGGWPWSETGPVHSAKQARFARYPNGEEDFPG